MAHPEGTSPTPIEQTSGKNDKLTWPPSSQPLAVLCLALNVGIMLPGHWNMPGWPLGKQTLARNKVPDRADKRTMSLGSKQPSSVPHRKGEWEQSCGHENQSHLSRETRGSQMPGRQIGLCLLTWGTGFPWPRGRISLKRDTLNGPWIIDTVKSAQAFQHLCYSSCRSSGPKATPAQMRAALTSSVSPRSSAPLPAQYIACPWRWTPRSHRNARCWGAAGLSASPPPL